MDYRIYAPRYRRQNQDRPCHGYASFGEAPGIDYHYVLMDSWYAVVEIMKYLIAERKIFYCPLKTNRKVDDSGGQNKYVQIKELQWSDQELREGKVVKVHKMAADNRFKLFRVALTTERTDYIATNDMTQSNTEAAEEKSGIRWTIEQFHREDKQTTGMESCQCRKERSQRNHIGIAMLVWTRLKTLAYQMKKTVYQLKFGQLDEYLTHQLKNLNSLLRKSYKRRSYCSLSRATTKDLAWHWWKSRFRLKSSAIRSTDVPWHSWRNT